MKDPAAPHTVARFFQKGPHPYVENLCGDHVKLNGAPFDYHALQDGDKLTVASSVIEVSLLK